MTDEKLEELRTGVRKAKRLDISPQEDAGKKIYFDPNSTDEPIIGVPGLNLYACLMEAGRDVKNGKKQISTKGSSTLPSFLWIDQEFLPFKDQEKAKAWVVDKRRGMMDSGGKRIAVCIVRPKFTEWSVDVTMTVDDDICAVETVRELVRIAGNKVGLCDFRPTSNGSFGRFFITDWKVRRKN